MKLVTANLILLLVSSAWGQDGKKPSEPESLSVFYYLDSSGQLVPLESQVIRLQHKYRALGFAGGTTVYLVKGEKSPVRLHAESKPEFIVRLEVNVDPLEAVEFYRLNGENNSRVMPIVDFDPLGRASLATMRPATIDFNAMKQGASSRKVVPIQALVPGEYCLIIKALNQWPRKIPGFCFGVDAAVSRGTP
jgi:hypothetical protein